MDEKKATLAGIVGTAGVVDHPKVGEAFSLAHDMIPPIKPRFLVKPRNVEEVQKIVLWANETQTPLVPVSSGGPHFRGGYASNCL
jgi:FAD/FMN-containing dehydrogenase